MIQDDYLNILNRLIDKTCLKVNNNPKDLFSQVTHKALVEHLDAIDRGEMEPWSEMAS